jgi:hypothetical protein
VKKRTAVRKVKRNLAASVALSTGVSVEVARANLIRAAREWSVAAAPGSEMRLLEAIDVLDAIEGVK